jgi:hypothetical protein
MKSKTVVSVCLIKDMTAFAVKNFFGIPLRKKSFYSKQVDQVSVCDTYYRTFTAVIHNVHF